MDKNFYITTTLPYVNSDPHIGFAMELVRADVIARSKKLQGYNVFFNTGTDEHGQKLFNAAKDAGKDVKLYVDEYAESFKKLPKALGVSEGVHFIRTTDTHHVMAAQEFWKRCSENGYIYKKTYRTKYCVGCELEKTDSELVDGRCPLHPNKDLELIDEENYFFKFSAFQEKLLKFYSENPNFVVPDFRFNEIRSFVERGLEDFSISRIKEKMSWGVPVPGDDGHVMYVWFDALANYITTLGWPEDKENFEKFWINGTPVQYCGKDNLRQQSAMWQAMLMAAGIPNTKHIVVNGFVTAEGGVKMSKSLGNTINPSDLINEYGADALRYFLLAELNNFEDSPFTMERFKESYNSKLANGIGNLTSRIMKMAVINNVTYKDWVSDNNFYDFVDSYVPENFDIKRRLEEIWSDISALDYYIQKEEPFKKIKINIEEGKKDLAYLLSHLYRIGVRLKPFLPETSKKIIDLVISNKVPDTPLFLRKD